MNIIIKLIFIFNIVNVQINSSELNSFDHQVCFSEDSCESLADMSSSSKLIMAQAIFRHGERNPLQTYPTDPSTESDFPEGFSKLTPRGKRQVYELGEYFRERYQSLLHGADPEKLVHMQSSMSKRTIASAKFVLAAMIPGTPYQSFDPLIIDTYVPVPVEVLSDDKTILPYYKPCALHEHLRKQYLESDEYKAIMKKFEKTLVDVKKFSGIDVNDIVQVMYLYDTLKIEKIQNRCVPDWVDSVYDDLEYITMLQSKSHTITKEMARIRGYLIKEILENFDKKIADNSFYNIAMFSGHDLTLINVLNGLGLFDDIIPPFASCVMFELHEIDGKHYLKLFYKTDLEKEAAKICDMPLDEFKEKHKDVIPTGSYEDECSLKK